jgi:hypothetical protein
VSTLRSPRSGTGGRSDAEHRNEGVLEQRGAGLGAHTGVDCHRLSWIITAGEAYDCRKVDRQLDLRMGSQTSPGRGHSMGTDQRIIIASLGTKALIGEELRQMGAPACSTSRSRPVVVPFSSRSRPPSTRPRHALDTPSTRLFAPFFRI